ncbi:MAG: membrane protein insertase YidC [Proteobacteria bacterium]|nr:membrane protein insertase YidC [Pseudomonadota bacterium]
MNSTTKNPEHQKAFAILICLFLAYMYKEMVWDPYFIPNKAILQQTATTVGAAQDTATPTIPMSKELEDPTKLLNPSDQQIAGTGEVLVETSKIKAKVAILGGRLTELLLKDFKDKLGSENLLNIVEHGEKEAFPFGVYSGAVSDADVKYNLISNQQVSSNGNSLINSVNPAEKNIIMLQGNLADGRKITKSISFNADSYLIDLAVQVDKPAVDGSAVALEWTNFVSKNSPSLLDPYNKKGFTWYNGEKTSREEYGNLTELGQDIGLIKWVSMGDKYFMSALISESPLSSAKLFRTGELYRTKVYGTPTDNKISFFIGPKNYDLLQETGMELKRNIDFGITAIIAAPLLILLHHLYDFTKNYGLAIIILTLIVKLLTYPLTASSFKNMKAMQDLTPELKKIKETIKDKQQQQVKTMQLYKEKGVNPLGGCLPMLLQMPIFIGLFSALSLDIELRHTPFALWVTDLSAPEHLYVSGVGIPVMVIIFVASLLIQQWITPTAGMDPAQKKAMMIVPLIFGFMFASMPAGLTIYYLTNNFISIFQQKSLKNGNNAKAVAITVSVAAVIYGIGLFMVKMS